MVSRITAALAARYKAIQEKEKGFTLIELLVVVIIIGVLAAIAIPIYMGVQNNAKDSAVKSDLSNAKTAVVSAYTNDNNYDPSGVLSPETVVGDTTLGKLGATESASYEGTGYAPTVFEGSTNESFCIEAMSGDTEKPFKVTATKGVAEGECASGDITAAD